MGISHLTDGRRVFHPRTGHAPAPHSPHRVGCTSSSCLTTMLPVAYACCSCQCLKWSASAGCMVSGVEWGGQAGREKDHRGQPGAGSAWGRQFSGPLVSVCLCAVAPLLAGTFTCGWEAWHFHGSRQRCNDAKWISVNSERMINNSAQGTVSSIWRWPEALCHWES